MKIDKEMTMFAIASFMFLIDVFNFVYDFVSRVSTALNILICAAYVTYAITYFANEKSLAQKSRCFSALFVLLAALVILTSAFDISQFNAQKILHIVTPIYFCAVGLLTSIPAILPLVLLVFLARSLYVHKVAKKYKKGIRALSYVVYFAAIAFLIICSLLVFKPNPMHFDDEGFITLNAANVFAKGQNPYTANFSSILGSNLSKTVQGVTFTTNNTIVGFLSYPALSFLVFAPFALISNADAYHFTYGGLYVLFPLFVFILVMTISYVLKEEYIKKPPVMVIVSLLFLLSFFESVENFLMFALMMLALYKIESKYLWVVLGVLASLQEEVWIVVLLFLIYAVRNYGMKRGMYEALGTALVFILINGYFIMLSPSSFARGILSTVSGALTTGPYPVFGYSIMSAFPSLSESMVFFAALIAVLIMAYCLNVKKLIPLFGLLPLMFLFHGTLIYYVFFVSALVVSMYIDEPVMAFHDREMPVCT